jgi:hypothetical protein
MKYIATVELTATIQVGFEADDKIDEIENIDSCFPELGKFLEEQMCNKYPNDIMEIENIEVLAISEDDDATD